MTEGIEIAQLYLFVFSLFWAALTLILAKKKGFFIIPAPVKEVPVFLRQVIVAFASYLLLALVILPLLYFGIGYLITGTFTGIKELSFISQRYIEQSAILLIFLWFILYMFLIKKETRQFIYWGGKRLSLKEKKKSAFIGLLSFVISYPLMLVVSLLFGFLSYLIFKKSGVEQVAVQQLKMTLDYPLLFAFMVLLVMVLVPFIEELLFRGFLQSWLKKFMPRSLAIITTAFIFSVVHFSRSQGTGNIELIASLFVLACFLGFIYEREQNLIAPIVMHGAFNGFSAFMIALSNAT